MAQRPAARTPVQASSRLLTMKFMRPSVPSHPSLKNNNNNTTKNPHKAERAAINSAIAEEEAKREAALIASGAAEERWRLKFAKRDGDNNPDSPPGERIGNVRIIVNGLHYNEDDSSSDDDDEDVEGGDEFKGMIVGKRSFGGWTRQEVITPKKRPEPDSDSDSDSSNSDSSSVSEAEEALKRKKAKEKKRKQQQKAAENERNGFASRDKQQATPKRGMDGLRGLSNMQCYNCGKTGHMKADCLQQPKKPTRHDSKRRRIER